MLEDVIRDMQVKIVRWKQRGDLSKLHYPTFSCARTILSRYLQFHHAKRPSDLDAARGWNFPVKNWAEFLLTKFYFPHFISVNQVVLEAKVVVSFCRFQRKTSATLVAYQARIFMKNVFSWTDLIINWSSCIDFFFVQEKMKRRSLRMKYLAESCQILVPWIGPTGKRDWVTILKPEYQRCLLLIGGAGR